jgi:hypothetical protein
MSIDQQLARRGGVRVRRSPVAWSRDLVLAIALTYVTVTAVFFAAGYLIGRLLL